MRYKRPLLGAAFLVCGGAAAAGTWPLWADGMAKAKAQEWLEARFEDVAIGGFMLERDHAILHDVHLRRQGLSFSSNQITVGLDVSWKGDARVTYVDVHDGLVSGEFQPDERSTETASSSVTNETPVISGHEITLDISYDTMKVRGVAEGELIPEGVSVRLREGQISRGEHLVAFKALSGVINRDNPFPLSVYVDGASVELLPRTSVSSVTGSVTLEEKEAIHVAFDLHGAAAEKETLWSLRGTIDRQANTGVVDLKSDKFEIGLLGDSFVEAIPGDISPEALVHGEGHVEWEDGVFSIDGTAGITNASFHHPMLALQRVHGISFETALKATLVPSERRLEVHDARVALPGTIVLAEGLFSDSEDDTKQAFRLHLTMPETPCDAVLKALPQELVPGLKGFKLDGKMGADLTVNIIPSRPEETVLSGDIGIKGCKLLEVPEIVEKLKGPFVHKVRRKDGRTQTLFVDFSDSIDYTPLDQIAPAMVAAVLTTEDGGFWKHDGFLRSQFEASLRRNVELGKIRRGASTLTMQMVKNVLLSHERTLSRKVQELFLTWVIEQKLTKKRIMEIYLNVVELGPGIYGVTDASMHYFGKHPSELNGKEAAFLATLLPSPIRRHEQWCLGTGFPTEAYAKKVDRVFGFMHSRKRIDEAAWALDRETVLEFNTSNFYGEEACKREGRFILNSPGIQWAESGLLAGRSDSGTEEVSAIEDVDVDALLEDIE